MKHLWHLWALALGEKAHKKDQVADKVAIIRSFIFTTYLITNAFIVAGVIRHWNDREINVQVEIYENSNSNKNTYPEGRHNLGVGGDASFTRVYNSDTIKNRTGEYE